MPRCRRRRCGASRPAPDRNPTPPPRPCMENDETVPNQLYDSNQPTAPYDLVPTYCYHLSGSDDIHSIDGLKDFQIGSHLSRVILKDFRIGSIGVFNFFQHAMSRRARDAKTYADSPNFPSYERVYGLNKTFDMEERKTFISSVCNHLWLEKLYGITRVAVYGVDSICVVMRNKDLVQLEKDLARLKGSTYAMFETLPNALINEVEDLACPPRESRTINCKRSQKPFGVVSVIAGTNKVPKISGHEDSGDKIDELKAIKFLREEMNSASTFTFHKTVKTTLCAFHHLWNKKFKPNKIRALMARSSLSRRNRNIRVVVAWWMQLLELIKVLVLVASYLAQQEGDTYIPHGLVRAQKRSEHLKRLIYENNVYCRDNLRVDTPTFVLLCDLLESRGLRHSKGVRIDDMVFTFLNIIAHHTKVRSVKFSLWRSGETIHKHFHRVLKAFIRCHSVLLAKPEPVPTDSTDQRWKWFKGCLGALDGTHIPVRVDMSVRPRYRTRKRQIAMNVLGVCNPNMEFIFVLPGWEGSAADGRVLRDAIHMQNGLRVPRGQYYLCDAGYTNGEGFLAPYRGQRYHRSDWGGSAHRPSNFKELFNYKHSSARNVIERGFGAIKMRCAILRSPSFYPIRVQSRIVNACCLLHNLIRREMPDDLIMDEVDAFLDGQVDDQDDIINQVEPSQQWTDWRDQIAHEMWNISHPS